jgi:hypothetical protein
MREGSQKPVAHRNYAGYLKGTQQLDLLLPSNMPLINAREKPRLEHLDGHIQRDPRGSRDRSSVEDPLGAAADRSAKHIAVRIRFGTNPKLWNIG